MRVKRASIRPALGLVLSFAASGCGGPQADVRRAAARELSCRESEIHLVHREGDVALVQACQHRLASLTRDNGRWQIDDVHASTDGQDPEARPRPSSELRGEPLLDRARIEVGLATVTEQLGECGTKRATDDTVVVVVHVSPSGNVTDVTALIADTALATCVVAAVREARFAPTRSGGRFRYPLRLGR